MTPTKIFQIKLCLTKKNVAHKIQQQQKIWKQFKCFGLLQTCFKLKMINTLLLSFLWWRRSWKKKLWLESLNRGNIWKKNEIVKLKFTPDIFLIHYDTVLFLSFHFYFYYYYRIRQKLWFYKICELLFEITCHFILSNIWIKLSFSISVKQYDNIRKIRFKVKYSQFL